MLKISCHPFLSFCLIMETFLCTKLKWCNKSLHMLYKRYCVTMNQHNKIMQQSMHKRCGCMAFAQLEPSLGAITPNLKPK